jgi:hypothetical protein
VISIICLLDLFATMDLVMMHCFIISFGMRKSMFGIQQPVGICIVPKYTEPNYMVLPKEQWSPYRLKNSELGRSDFTSMHEEIYEQMSFLLN